MTALILRNSISRSLLRRGFLLIPVVLACFALSPHARATCNQDGCDSNDNTFQGNYALYNLTSGTDNTAFGYQALDRNTTGYQNTANGSGALENNTYGLQNTASGFSALYSSTNGIENTAIGYEALYSNTGDYANNNTALGYEALYSNTTGSDNIALGYNAGYRLTTGNYNIDIGNSGVAGEAKTIRIGDSNQNETFIAGIYGVNEGGGIPLAVYISNNGQLGTLSSSRRFKKEIKPMDQTSQVILGLQPVTFHYKSDPSGTAQFGLIAEEVEKVSPDLVVRDADGKAYSVRYEAVNAMLLNEFLKEHKKVQDLEATVGQQQKDFQATVARQQRQIEALTATVQKVSAELATGRVRTTVGLELSKVAPPTVLNNQ